MFWVVVGAWAFAGAQTAGTIVGNTKERTANMADYGSRALETEFEQVVRAHGGDMEGRRAGDAYLAGTHARYHGDPTPWALMPKIFDAATMALLRDAAETTYSIMDKVTRAYVADPALRAAFGFDSAFAQLCALPCGYDCQIPLARVDIFLNEETGAFKFCEFNTDGSAGMVTVDEVNRAVAQAPSWTEFAAAHPGLSTFSVCESWVDALLETYAEWLAAGGNGPKTPAVAIVDYAESIDADDVQHFVELFAARGISARFTDVRDLRIADEGDDAHLADAEGAIDLVWRRAVTSELWEKPCDGRAALIASVERNLACAAGGFRTWPCATKTIFALLWGDEVQALLSDDEVAFVREHVPFTEVLGPQSDLSRFAERARWIVKPAGGYNSVGVLAGLDATDDEWRQALKVAARDGGIIQEYAEQYRTPCLRGTLVEGEHRGSVDADLADELGFAPASNMEGLFLFRGKFAGVYTRAGFANTIGEWTSRLNVGCFYQAE